MSLRLKSEGLEIEALTGTRLRVLVLLRLLDDGRIICNIHIYLQHFQLHITTLLGIPSGLNLMVYDEQIVEVQVATHHLHDIEWWVRLLAC